MDETTTDAAEAAAAAEATQEAPDAAPASVPPTRSVPRPGYWPGRIEDIREFLDLAEVREELTDLGGWDGLEIEGVVGQGDYVYYMVSAVDVLSRRVLLCWDGSFRTVGGELAQAQVPGDHRDLPTCLYPGCETVRDLEKCHNSDGRLACAAHRTYRDGVFVCEMCDQSAEASAAEARAARQAGPSWDEDAVTLAPESGWTCPVHHQAVERISARRQTNYVACPVSGCEWFEGHVPAALWAAQQFGPALDADREVEKVHAGGNSRRSGRRSRKTGSDWEREYRRNERSARRLAKADRDRFNTDHFAGPAKSLGEAKARTRAYEQDRQERPRKPIEPSEGAKLERAMWAYHQAHMKQRSENVRGLVILGIAILALSAMLNLAGASVVTFLLWGWAFYLNNRSDDCDWDSTQWAARVHRDLSD